MPGTTLALVGRENVSPKEFQAEVPPVREEVACLASAVDGNVLEGVRDSHLRVPTMRFQSDRNAVGWAEASVRPPSDHEAAQLVDGSDPTGEHILVGVVFVALLVGAADSWFEIDLHRRRWTPPPAQSCRVSHVLPHLCDRRFDHQRSGEVPNRVPVGHGLTLLLDPSTDRTQPH